MKSTKVKFMAILLVAVLAVGVFGGCASNEESNNDTSEKKETVKLGYVNWAEGIAMTHLAQAILQEKMGYDVETTLADVAPIFTSVAAGNTDAFMDVWMPVTHETYMEKYGDDIVELTTSYEGARIGLVVPSYVEIDSIEELKENSDMFNGEIVGIDAGAGLMTATETALEDYDLDLNLLTGSGPSMTAALDKAIKAEEPIVVTGWTPHWMFARYDLKFLDDPKGVFGDAEEIRIITRKGFAEDMPEVNEFLSNFSMTDEELSDLMGVVEDGASPLEAATEWMNDNEAVVNEWIPTEK